MNIRVVKIYEAYNTDGGGMGYHQGAIGYFRSKLEADEIAKKAVYAGVKQCDALEIANDPRELEGTITYYLLAKREPIDLDQEKLKRNNEEQRKALANLTPEQIKLLGLEDLDKKLKKK